MFTYLLEFWANLLNPKVSDLSIHSPWQYWTMAAFPCKTWNVKS